MVMDGQFSSFYRFFKGGEWYVHTMFHSYLRLSKGMYVSSFVWQIPRNVWKILTYLLVSPGVFLGYRRIWYGVLLTNWNIQAPNHKSKLHVPWKTVPSCLHSLSYQPHDSIFTLNQKIYVTPGLVQLNSHYDYIYIIYTIRSLLQFYPYHLILKASWYRSPNSPSRSASVARSRSPTPSRGHRPWPPRHLRRAPRRAAAVSAHGRCHRETVLGWERRNGDLSCSRYGRCTIWGQFWG
jgi:hypothetical protein